ncbi:MAG TPA: alpha/beta hydrolase [Streptosporangiaceae bacterium]|nr:alpha/beta hydrolase [Streptosporangiaceae bacterium]
MHVEVNGTRLWFDVDGPSLVPEGPRMLRRPTVVLVHGGPGSYDHSYFKPHFGHLAGQVQVVYLDIRDHGRSARNDPADWSFEVCADDLRAFCDTIGIAGPVVLGHSMGGFIAMLYGARHPGHPGALILQSTMARFDLARLADGFRGVAGAEVAELARRDYGGDPITDEQWAAVFAAFGPRVPGAQELARRIQNPELGRPGMDLLRRLDVTSQLVGITCPTLVCVGELDPVTPVAAAREIAGALSPGIGRLAVIQGAGHFPWLDQPGLYWPLITGFATMAASGPGAQAPGTTG